MIKKVKHTLRHSIIYGLGHVGAKLIGVVLLPLYTRYIAVSEYGILAVLEVTIAMLTQVLIMGQPNALLRLYSLTEYKEKRAETFATILGFTFLCGLIFWLSSLLLLPLMAPLFSWPPNFVHLVHICAAIIFSEMIALLLLSHLRSREESTLYAFTSFARIFVILGLNIYLIVYAGTGIRGILYANLFGNLAIILVLLPIVFVRMVPKFDAGILIAATRFGFPLIFAGLANMLLNMGDRYLLRWLAGYDEVGLYNLGYKIAGVLNVLLIQSFTLTFLPAAYKIYGKTGDKRYFAKMMTYFVFVLVLAGLAVASFSREMVETFALNADYLAAYKIIPLIALAYIFSGAKSVATLGLYLKGKTKHIAYSTIIAVLFNLALNLLLIPQYGMMGAAVATVAAFLLLFFITYWASNRFYRIPFENLKLFKMLVVGIALFFLTLLTDSLELLPRIVLKISLIASYPILLYFLDFYEKIELQRLKEGFSRISGKLIHSTKP